MSGEYCGPYWSDGRFQSSVAGKATPRSEFDATCKEHDAVYATDNTKAGRNKADKTFYNQNMGKGALRSIAAALVSTNQLGRMAIPNNQKRLRGTESNEIIKSLVDGGSTSINKARTLSKDQLIIHLKKLSHNKPIMTKTNRLKNQANKKLGTLPLATSKTVALGVPRSTNTASGSTIIKHREYLGAVVGTTTILVKSYNVNPGLATTFPWLANIANNYEKYRVKKLSAQYVTSSGSTTGGRVGLAFGYNPSESNPESKQQFFSIIPNREEAPWEDIQLHIQPTGETKYIRIGGVSNGTVNTYDMGKLLVMTSNNASGAVVGEIFVEYEIELIRPHFGSIVSMEGTFVNPSSGFEWGASISVDAGVEIIQQSSGNIADVIIPGDWLIVYNGYSTTNLSTMTGITLTPLGDSLATLTLLASTIDTANPWAVNFVYKLLSSQAGDRLTIAGAAWGITSGNVQVAPFARN